MTAHLAARIHQHRNDTGAVFCRKSGLKTLVLAECRETIEDAIAREKTLKAWKRLIEEMNPEMGRSVRSSRIIFEPSSLG